METLNLQAKIREFTGNKVANFRAEGIIPAVVYGKTVKPTNLALNAKDFWSIYNKAGDNTVVDLNIENDKNHKVLIQNVDFNPTQDKIMHVEFLVISLTDKVKVEIPVHLINTEIAEKLGGNLIKAMSEIEIEALPNDLPHSIEVDCSKLQNFGETIHVKDLNLGNKIKILSDLELPLVSFDAPEKEEIVEAPVTEIKESEAKKEESTIEEPKQ